MSLSNAVRAVLRVRTNVVLIVASALAYFFFAGLRGFAVQFAEQHYGISQPEATGLTVFIAAGAVVGLLGGGRLADRLLAHGRKAARLEVSGGASLLAGVLFVPALIVNSVSLAVPLLIGAAACLGAANPPLDAARLDIMLPDLWGRAEAVRTVLRTAATAVAPVSFGVMSVTLFTGKQALEDTFLVAVSSLWIAAVIVLLGRGRYQKDVEAAERARDENAEPADEEPAGRGRSA
jgi:dipeptide/tripeptide permease